MAAGQPIHRETPAKPDPLRGRGFDEMLKAQRQRIRRNFDAMTERKRAIYQRIIDTTPNDWTMIGLTKGAWGRGAKPRGD